MLKGAVGSSVLPDAYEAGKEAAKKSIAGMENAKVAFVYSSCVYDGEKLLAGVRESLPGAKIVGNTSFTGVITPEGFIGGADGFVGVLSLGGGDVTVGVAGMEKKATARETGRMVAQQAMKSAGKTVPPAYFHMVASSGEEEFYLKGITDVVGRIPFFGGSAADNTISGEWKIFAGEKAFPDGVAAAFFYTGGAIANCFTGAYRETEDVGIITKVKNNRTLTEIDGVPALKKMGQWMKVDPESLKGDALLAATVTSPLGVKDRLGDLIAIRHPMNGNDDYSIAVGSNLAEKTAIIRMEATVNELVNSPAETMRELKRNLHIPAAYHLVHCGGRRAGIGDRIGEVAAQIKKEAGDIPFIVEFTFGEYGFVDGGNNTIGGLMLSFTGFEE